jgi:hypothetical protein
MSTLQGINAPGAYTMLTVLQKWRGRPTQPAARWRGASYQGDLSHQSDAVAIETATLSPETAARICRLYGDVSVLVNGRCPRALVPTVARHALRCHESACTEITCPGLWIWLAEPAVSVGGVVA